MLVSRRKASSGDWTRSVSGETHPRHRHTPVSRIAHRERIGTALKSRIESLIKIKTSAGCGCANLASDMDRWGIEGCESRRSQIVDHLVRNREVLIQAIRQSDWPLAGAISAVTAIVPDAILRQGANWLLSAAIEDARRIAAAHRPRVKANRTNLVIRAKALTPRQHELHRKATGASNRTPDPFHGTPVVHFGAHLWPRHDNWRWHAAQWNELAQQINGKCVVGVVTDEHTATADEVCAVLSDRFEIFETANTPQGENPTFRELQKRLPAGTHDVWIYVHGKGVRDHTQASEAVRVWTELMYETVVFNHAAAVRKLAEGYKAFGSFRTFGDKPLNPRNHWHYSGTFFICRAKHAAGTSVKDGYGGVEAWPGDTFQLADGWCEFADNLPFMAGYDIEYLRRQLVDAQMQWEVDRIGGVRCEQHVRELEWFCSHLRQGDRILVIGSKHGGLEAAIKRRLHLIQTVSIDIAPQSDNTQEVIVGSSSDHGIQLQAKRRGPFDVVFIDGDHTYEGAKRDWEFAQQLQPRVIAFHDIANAVKHRAEGCEVDRLWAEIKTIHRTGEKIVGCGWGGIGVVTLCEKL